jgi:hypothetical protein
MAQIMLYAFISSKDIVVCWSLARRLKKYAQPSSVVPTNGWSLYTNNKLSWKVSQGTILALICPFRGKLNQIGLHHFQLSLQITYTVFILRTKCFLICKTVYLISKCRVLLLLYFFNGETLPKLYLHRRRFMVKKWKRISCK